MPVPAVVPGTRPRSRGRVIALTLLSLLGLGALGAGGSALAWELTRKPTTAEVEVAGTKELAARWRIRTAGEIFPATVDYTVSAGFEQGHDDVRLRARRVGIATSTGCAEALDKEAAAVLAENGCRALLRATYVDATGTLVTTIGIAVLPGADQARAAETGFGAIEGVHGKHYHGLRAAGFPGTGTERFLDRQRQKVWLVGNSTPYLFLRTSGWTDGRAKVPEDRLVEEFGFAEYVTNKVVAAFAPANRPCEMRGVRC